jgi:hypothetical protein
LGVLEWTPDKITLSTVYKDLVLGNSLFCILVNNSLTKSWFSPETKSLTKDTSLFTFSFSLTNE